MASRHPGVAAAAAADAIRSSLAPGQVRALVQLPVVASVVGFKPIGVDGAPPSPEKNGHANKGKEAAVAKPAEEDDPAKAEAEAKAKAERDRKVFAKELPPYVPAFTKAFEWICVHTGGRAVIDAIENNLALVRAPATRRPRAPTQRGPRPPAPPPSAHYAPPPTTAT